MEEQNTMQPRQMLHMSAEIDKISEALSAFQGDLKQPTLNKEVKGSYSFHYADLSEVMRAAAPGLKANGLAVTQLMGGGHLRTLLLHKSGQWFCSVMNMGDQPITQHQKFGSALTYLKRYSYCAILGIVADDDDDANGADGTGNTTHNRNTASEPAYTTEQLNTALVEVGLCSTMDDINALWSKYSKNIPALCKKGTEFYNAVAQKSTEINSKQA